MAKPMMTITNDMKPSSVNSYNNMRVVPVRASVTAYCHKAGQQGRMGTTMSMSLGNQMGMPKGIKMSKLNNRTVATRASKQDMVSGNYFTAAPTMSASTQRSQISVNSNMGFQASSFFNSALSNTGL